MCPYEKLPEQEPARGGFANVYKAKRRNHSGPPQFFALKEIVMKNKDWLKDVEQEIKILQRIFHPNTLVLREAFYCKSDPRKVYLVTLPWAPQSLHNFIYNLTKADPSDSKGWYVPGNLGQWPSIVLQCSLGLSYLHASNVKHKDLKPHNILLLQEEDHVGKIRIRPIIADFGLSKNFERGGKTENRGTPEFKAPEQLQKNKPSELYSDIWSLGCCFAFVWILLHSGKEGLADLWGKIMSSGDERGFHTESNQKYMHELLKKSFTLSRDEVMIGFIHDFRALVKKMLDKNPSNRPKAWKLAFDLIRLERWVESHPRLLPKITLQGVMGTSISWLREKHDDRLIDVDTMISWLRKTHPDRFISVDTQEFEDEELKVQISEIIQSADKIYKDVKKRRSELHAYVIDSVRPTSWCPQPSMEKETVSRLRRKINETLVADLLILNSMADNVSMYWSLGRYEDAEVLELQLVDMMRRGFGLQWARDMSMSQPSDLACQSILYVSWQGTTDTVYEHESPIESEIDGVLTRVVGSTITSSHVVSLFYRIQQFYERQG